VIVNRVDGETLTGPPRGRAARAAQGDGGLPPRKGFHTATQHTFDLEAKPCVRYYVAAKLASTTTQDWQPVIRSEERIVECEAKFKVAGK
jgi:hypothetical protein